MIEVGTHDAGDRLADTGVAEDAGNDSGFDASLDAGTDAATSDAGRLCPEPYTGDLIKGSGTAVYYIGTDDRRYVFPNEPTYFTWYTGFDDVVTVPDTDLVTIPIGGNVTIRPGTYLVKIRTDPRVYAVTPCGVIRWIESEPLALALYGDDWAGRIVDVPDAFFVNYAIGERVTEPVHPDGQLVTYADDSRIYLIEGGRKRLVSERAFIDSGFRMEFVIETTIRYPDGRPYDCAEPLYQETVCVT